MRTQFIVVVLAVTLMIVLAFLIPLARLIDDFAQDRGVTLVLQEAEALARSVTLVTDLDRAVVSSLVAVGDPQVTRSVVFQSGITIGGPPGDTDAVARARGGQAVLVDEGDGVAAYVPVVASSERPVVRAFVGSNVLDRNVAKAWIALAGLGLGLLALAAFIADRLARSIVRPVEKLAAAATRFGDGDLSQRVDLEGPSELQTVGRVFNRIGDRLDHLLRSERESVADLSHRLRTPLTALQLEAEQLPDSDAAGRVRTAVDAMGREVDHLIREARRPIRTGIGSRADLTAVVRDRVRFWEPLLTDQGRAISVDQPAVSVVVTAAVDDLEAAVDALIGNVLAHTDEGVSVWISVLADPPTLVVEDEGRGFPNRSASERGMSTGGSTGLGLDIARRTVEEGDGQMELGHRPGGGARVTLRFGRDG